MPVISVIVPVYKVEKYIHRCVDSILNQTFTDFELILVDDGSPDNCPAICDEYAAKDSRVVVIHQENGGLSAARNAGIDWAFANSESEWIGFVDSDDWVHPCFLEQLFRAANEYQVSVSCCEFQRIYESDSPRPVHNLMTSLMKTEDVYCVENGIRAYPWRFLYSKKLFADIQFPVGRIYEDVFTTHKLIFQSAHVAVVNQKLYYYYCRENSLAHGAWSLHQLDMIYAYEENLQYFAESESNKLRKSLARGYLIAIHSQAAKVQNSRLEAGEKKHYSHWLRRKMRAALLRYARKADVHIGTDGWLFAAAYPRLMDLYWFVCGQLNKLKK